MKIGILTFHRGPNYGGFLQAWSLRKAIRGLGHDAEVINYKNADHYRNEKFRIYPTRRIGLLYGKWCKVQAFERVYPQLAAGKPITDPMLINWSKYDVIVVGSDVVWDNESSQYGHDGIYFGAVDASDCRWVAYAPSCGRADPHGELPESMRQGLTRFQSIGVRDANTQELVFNALGNRPELVVDPTWLTEPEIAPEDHSRGDELVVYGYGKIPAPLEKQIVSYARENSLRIISPGYHHSFADEIIMGIDPFEWIRMIGRAHAVVTTTFHGSLYSLKLGKPFVSIGLNSSKAKIFRALEQSGTLRNLATDDSDIRSMLQSQFSSDTSAPYLRCLPLRESSLGFLRTALSRQ